MPGTLTYPIYADVEPSVPRRRAYTWNSQHRSTSRVTDLTSRAGRLSLTDNVVRNNFFSHTYYF